MTPLVRHACRFALLGTGMALLLSAQSRAAKPVRAQSASTMQYSAAPDGSETVEIRNVSYEVTGTGVPGRPAKERLLLRKTARSKQVLDDIGEEATVTLEAWRLGDDSAQKPLYALSVDGTDGQTVDNALFVASRGLEEVEWWSVYQLGTGKHLFDTYVPLVSFSISRETVQTRYAGLDVPADDEKDTRLKQPNVVAVLSYASENRVIREALLTCDDVRQAQQLRSYADVTRVVTAATSGKNARREPTRTIRIVFTENYPSPPNPVTVTIPLAGDDLDLAHAQLPPRLHLAAWRR